METQKPKLDLHGIFPPIATPFTGNGGIDFEQLKNNLDKWNQTKFRGFVVLGSNGEYPLLSSEEKVQLVSFVKKHVSADKLVIAGSGCESTHETVSLTQKMASAGADAVLVITPSYYKNAMNDVAMEMHYRAVANESPIPVILYSVPANTSIDLSTDVVVRLSFHPNIIGLKDSGGNIVKIGLMLERTRGSDFQIVAGSASFLLPALMLGCVGGICALANVLGNEVCRLYDLYQSGDLEAAKQLQLKMIAPNTAVTQQFGVAGLKAAMDWTGVYGGPVRAPLVPLNDDQLKLLRAAFISSGYFKD